MAKMKTVTMVKPHYIGEQSLSQAFTGILKRQIESSISQHNIQILNTSLKDDRNCAKIHTSNLLSESEDLC